MAEEVPESAQCCVIPIERAEILLAEVEEAMCLVAQLEATLVIEHQRFERVKDALAGLIGEELAERIAEGEDSLELASSAAGDGQRGADLLAALPVTDGPSGVLTGGVTLPG